MQPARYLEQLQPSYIREILAAASQPEIISLAGGLPSDQHFPLAALQQQFNRLSQEPAVFQYGSTQGYLPLIKVLRQRFELTDKQDLIITTGSQQGLDLIARAYINPGDKVAMEAPSYLGALQVFHLAQAEICSIPQTDTGPDLAALQRLFAEETIKLFYAVPDFHNPTGRCWDLNTRRRVAELCEEYKVTLVEDAPYRELRFNGSELPLVASFCPDAAIVLRSFSKIAAPGMRIGVLYGPLSYLPPIIKVKQTADLHSAVPLQAALAGFLQSPDFAQHLEELKALYQSRYQALAKAITQLLPNCRQQAVDGGMFIWLELPEGVDADQLAKDALKAGVAVVPGSVFYDQGQADQAALRLNFSNAEPEKLAEAIKRLSQLIA